MSEEEKEVKTQKISRREFLKDAGLIVGGATVGSMALVNACGKTTVTAPGVTSTKTVMSTVTSTVPGPGGATVTTTVTAPGPGGSTATVTATKTVTSTVTETPAAAAANVTSFTVNGTPQFLANLKPSYSLAWVLREKLGLVGTKTGCNRGECGTCTVIMNGKTVYSCMVLAVSAEGANIQTVESLSNGITLNALQQAVFNDDALQCGFCAPGFLMSAQALLTKKPKPTIDEVREALSGHICTCGNTKFYVDAVMKV